MASIMEELRREQEDRDSRGVGDAESGRAMSKDARFGDYGGPGNSALDSADPDTTNLYVGNLAPTFTEETLFKLFASYGARPPSP